MSQILKPLHQTDDLFDAMVESLVFHSSKETQVSNRNTSSDWTCFIPIRFWNRFSQVNSVLNYDLRIQNSEKIGILNR